MDLIPDISIAEYDYFLPPEKIAQFPLNSRHESKLLIYKNNQVSEDIFKNIANHLPDSGLMIYNETRVIQARLLFTKETGAEIEIFCLEPVLPTAEIQMAFSQTSGVVWQCLVGNSKKWKSGKLINRFSAEQVDLTIIAERQERYENYSLIKFNWEPASKTFSEILMIAGMVPLPPYVRRPAVELDKDRYQTIYAGSEGSVAAPTAGLHFTDKTLQTVRKKGISFEEVTLHVGAATFRPIAEEGIRRHEMHTEQIYISKRTIQNLLSKLQETIIIVGTTTARTIESLYWCGVKLHIDRNPETTINIRQWDPYNAKYNIGIPVVKSLEKVLENMETNQIKVLTGQTQLMIVPGYRFRITDILVTNFHMPKSTLLLLVSAFIGDGWKKAYQYALDNNFRFLSYGDSCLFFKHT